MPVPKRKRSRSRRDKRFANKGMEVKAITECKNCKEPIAPHKVCSKCGFYKGKKVMETKIDRAIKRGKDRQAKMAKKQEREGSSTVEPQQEQETKE
ncbi:50S ribosomal protein L32 [Candidatus Dependentiae bacterium]